jgi:hypothetical protein
MSSLTRLELADESELNVATLVVPPAVLVGQRGLVPHLDALLVPAGVVRLPVGEVVVVESGAVDPLEPRGVVVPLAEPEPERELEVSCATGNRYGVRNE